MSDTRQEREVEHYSHRERLEQINFEYFEDPRRNGDWNVEYFLYHQLKNLASPEKRLLCFGCGRGRDALLWAKLGYQVAAFDISPEQIENATYLRSKYGLENQVELTVAAAEHLPYESETFDVVAGRNIIHHVNIPAAMAEVHRVLRPGGTAVFRDSLSTPIRDFFRHSFIGKMILPAGYKSRTRKYDPTPDEHPLKKDEIAVIRGLFPNLKLHHFRVLSTLAARGPATPMLEKVDSVLMRWLPPLRGLGDHVVLVMSKEPASQPGKSST